MKVSENHTRTSNIEHRTANIESRMDPSRSLKCAWLAFRFLFSVGRWTFNVGRSYLPFPEAFAGALHGLPFFLGQARKPLTANLVQDAIHFALKLRRRAAVLGLAVAFHAQLGRPPAKQPAPPVGATPVERRHEAAHVKKAAEHAAQMRQVCDLVVERARGLAELGEDLNAGKDRDK